MLSGRSTIVRLGDTAATRWSNHRLIGPVHRYLQRGVYGSRSRRPRLPPSLQPHAAARALPSHLRKPHPLRRGPTQIIRFLAGESAFAAWREDFGHRPVGTRCFNSSNQLRMTLMRGVAVAGSETSLPTKWCRSPATPAATRKKCCQPSPVCAVGHLLRGPPRYAGRAMSTRPTDPHDFGRHSRQSERLSVDGRG